MSIEKFKIQTDAGIRVDAQAPVIISASRSTDIPAFYAQWFINRLKKGYAVWHNPFNQQPMYISFKNTRVIVFWTKNPKPLIPLLIELDARGINYYFQYTLNDYEHEGFEPNVQPLSNRVDTFKELSKLIGKDKVIWRFDPLIITPSLSVNDLLKKILYVGNLIQGYTNKLVFSFVDVVAYRKVQNNLVNETNLFTKEDVEKAEMNYLQKIELVEGLIKIKKEWSEKGWDIDLATCAEDIDLDKFGILHNKCIDGDLMRMLFKEDNVLLHYLTYGELPDPNSLLFEDEKILEKPLNLKDKGQRKICGCMISKDIGMYNTCNHLCVYCYANTSKELVRKNILLHNVNKESIID